MDRGEPKKECPSCGLGVSLEANICEFCGWDFEEEDEWILQIEKLERELLMEKQKFEPGTVNHKIESTLRSPVLERAEAAQATAQASEPQVRSHPKVAHTAEDLIERDEPPARERHEHRHAPAPVVAEEAPAPKVRKVRSVKAPPASVPSPAPARPVPEPMPQRSVETPAPPVRKVKLPEPKPDHASHRPVEKPASHVRDVKPPEPKHVQTVPEARPATKVRTVRKVKN